MNEQEELAHLTAPSSDPKQRMIDYWGQRCEKAEAEIERLHGIMQFSETASRQQREGFQAEIERLRGENVELRAALDRIMVGDDAVSIARAALEGKTMTFPDPNVAGFRSHDELKAEIERLKAALEAMTKIAQSHERTILELTKPSARAALERKP